jgi:hypothetical protein
MLLIPLLLTPLLLLLMLPLPIVVTIRLAKEGYNLTNQPFARGIKIIQIAKQNLRA